MFNLDLAKKAFSYKYKKITIIVPQGFSNFCIKK